MQMNLFKGSWKTTLAGAGLILTAVGAAAKAFADDDPATNVDWKALGAACVIGWGLICARDNNKSSEAVGAKPSVPASIILALGLLPLVAGCEAMNSPNVAREVGYWANTATVIGGTEALIDHPEWQPKFEQAIAAADALLGSTNQFGLETLSSIIAQLPPQMWESRDARIGFGILQAAIDRYSVPVYSVEQPIVARAGLENLRAGLKTAIARAAEFRKANKARYAPEPKWKPNLARSE